MSLESDLLKANARLKPLKISIQVKGSRLHLQATLPPKPTGKKLSDMECATQKWKQQKIYLGLRINSEGLKLAEAKAREISSLLMMNAFDWSDYWNPPEQEEQEHVLLTVEYWVERVKEEFFRDRDRPSLRRTWDIHHHMTYKRLPQDQEITEQMLIDCLKLQAPETRSRQLYYHALNNLVRVAGLPIDLSKYKGTYSPKQLNTRDIPDDDEIERLILSVKNPEWRYVFALMAIYGLRPHESWRCDLELPKVFVHEDTKTGSRVVFPVPQRWIELFEISKGSAPKITVPHNSEYGNRAGAYALDHGLPKPYTFRHAYALRMIHAGVPDAIAAAWMGHDLTVHNKRYQRWLSNRDHQKVFDSIKY